VKRARLALAVLGLALAGSLAPAALPGAALAAGRHTVPGTNCTVFPADDIWNTDVSKLPVHPMSKQWLATMHAGSTLLHPDFGGPPYGLPYQVVSKATPTHRVKFYWASESDRVPYPFGPRTPIEGGPHATGDRHALMVNKDTCVLYELGYAFWNGGRPKANAGAVFDLKGYRLRHDTWTSADAAGLPIFPGLVRYDEVKAGFIGHAIRFTVDHTRCAHVWPARHDASSLCASKYPPMGARFRMKASYSPAGFGRDARVFIRAFKHYGLILADNGSDWYFQGTEDRRWTNRLLDQLKRIPASAFVAVDESGCKIANGSARSSC